ncbi:MAG: hypothetical protein JWM80_1661 [Cyanobacteria bacterium RYN_339]|nr:hypothetical protein [Cyanobacteria bacterium RYN_339]
MKAMTIALTLALLAGCQSPTTLPRSTRLQARATAAAQVDHPTLLIKFKATPRAVDLSAFRGRFGLQNVGKIEALGIFIEQPTGDVDLGQLIEAIQASPLVEYVELNGKIDLQN